MRSQPAPTIRRCLGHGSADLREWLLPFSIVAWLALAFCSYHRVLGDLLHQWQVNPSYSHGPLVLPIAMWLLWRRRSILPRVSRPWIGGFGLLSAGHLLLLAGGYVYVPAVERWSIPIWLCGAIGLLWGRAVLIWSLPGVCFLAFMIPVPFQLEVLANQGLQWLSAWGGCVLLGLTSTFAVTDGYTLRMDSGQLGITADCSGLRMTIAIAALGYLLTFLKQDRSREGTSGRALVSRLAATLMLVVPAAVLANALRIAAMAMVIDRYRVKSYAAWAHDLGDWLVLPFAAATFLGLTAWYGRSRLIWQAEMAPRRRPDSDDTSSRRRTTAWLPMLRLASVPVLLSVLTGAAVWHYESQRERMVQKQVLAARCHEANAEWTRAAACYQKLMYLQPQPEDANHRHALVSLRAAETPDERERIFYQLESILQRAPFHTAALRTHLGLALELDMASAALRSAARLHSIDRHDPTTMQMCWVSRQRFAPDSFELPALPTDSFEKVVERAGPVADWRDDFVIEVAAACCRHGDSVDPRLTEAVAVVISEAATRVDSAKAHFAWWDFERRFGNQAVPLEHALRLVDGECPVHVAYEIHVASAQEALIAGRLGDAKQILEQALRLAPDRHRGYVVLGAVHKAERNWSASAAALLRGWRLADHRTFELGVELAESLVHAEHYPASTKLATLLAKQAESGVSTADRSLRLRLHLVQSRLDMRAARYKQALQKLACCHTWATLEASRSGTAAEWLSTVENLQAQCLVRSGRYTDAARMFQDRAGRADQPAPQWLAAARAWQAAGNGHAADRCYQNALYEQGHWSKTWLEYLEFLKATRGIAEAAGEVRLRDTGIRHDTAVADTVLAHAWEIVGRPDLALPHYRSAAQREPREVAALAVALARQGETQAAVELVTDPHWSVGSSVRSHTAAVVGVNAASLSDAAKASITRLVNEGVDETTRDVPFLLAAAEWYTQSGLTSSAIDAFDRALAAQPGNVVARNNLAMLLATEGRDLARAIACIEDILKQSVPAPEFLDTKGWILVQMDRAEEALPWLRKAADSSSSNDPIGQLHLATAYLATGDRGRAKKHLELARAGRIRTALLNASEQRAFRDLQVEFPKKPIDRGDDDA